MGRGRRTIARPVVLEGSGLHEGRPARLALRPAEPGSGVRFRRADLPGAEEIPALVQYREERPRRTALVRGGAEVHTVEHLLAAVAAAGITDLLIEIDQVEVPGLDGSAAPFLAAIRKAGLRDFDPPPPPPPRIVLDRVIEVEDGRGARIVAAPCPGRLAIEYVLEHAGLARSRFAIEIEEESFAREVAPARTFCLEREAEALRAAGLGRGATYENTLVIGGDGLPIGNALRFSDEYARHKVLDLVGDLALAGARLEARIFAYRSGHALNAALVRKLLEVAAPPSNLPCAESGAPPPTAARAADPPLVRPGGGELSVPEHVFEGHFPGLPVLPGVSSVAAMAEALGGGPIAAIRGARFRRVARPGQRLYAEVAGPEGARIVDAAGETVAEATIARRARDRTEDAV